MIVEVMAEFEPLVRGLVATLPGRIVNRVSSIREGENIGNGHTDPDGNIDIGFTQNPVFDVELLAHEIGHAADAELHFLPLSNGKINPCERANIFASYAVYGESLSDFSSLINKNNYLRMRIKLGKRSLEELEPLYKLIRDYSSSHRNPEIRWPEQHHLYLENVPFEIVLK